MTSWIIGILLEGDLAIKAELCKLTGRACNFDRSHVGHVTIVKYKYVVLIISTHNEHMLWNLVDGAAKVNVLLLYLLDRLSYLLYQAITHFVNHHIWVSLESAFKSYF